MRHNESLKALIDEAALTYEALARRVNALGRAQSRPMTYDRTSIAHWVRGTRPREPVPDLLCEVFTRRLGRTVDRRDVGMDAARASGRGRAMAPDVASATYPRVPEQRTPALARPATAVSARETAFARAERFFALQGDARGGRSTRPVLSAYLRGTVLGATGDVRPSSVSAPELAHAARTLVLLARACTDMRRFFEAQHILERAAVLAARAGDDAAEAIALRLQGEYALTRGLTALAATHVQHALHVSRRTPAGVRAYVAVQAAETSAVIGDDSQAMDWLDIALRLLAGAPDENLGPFGTYRPAALHFRQACVLRRLGRHDAARTALQVSMEERASYEERPIVLTWVARARLHAEAGQRTEAHDALLRARHLNAQVGSQEAAWSIARLETLLGG
ncbi:hypothetical protein OHB05_36905 [Streptomyces sp. NBC_00638]|uniref:hypothetical protein n=1 Tax=unclassified Streptomyces TaxID=2593676 RepID=UPI0022572295|nr:hypothetical protein [Streptomyces sp. NBC_00638]MCX5008155.1 hypothetical protein [Streptomyces sp. NBC_00638]